MVWPKRGSETWEAMTFSLHSAPAGRLLAGRRRNPLPSESGSGVAVTATGVPAGHSSWKVEAVTFTDSLKWTAMPLADGTRSSGAAGTAALTAGTSDCHFWAMTRFHPDPSSAKTMVNRALAASEPPFSSTVFTLAHPVKTAAFSPMGKTSYRSHLKSRLLSDA